MVWGKVVSTLQSPIQTLSLPTFGAIAAHVTSCATFSIAAMLELHGAHITHNGGEEG